MMQPSLKATNIFYKTFRLLSVISGILVFLMCTAEAADKDAIDQGRKLTLEQCQACHHYEGTEQAGNVAPPLLQMKSRFPDRNKLQRILFDPTKELGPDTMMPPFGRNKLLTDSEINLIIEYLYSL